VPVALDSKALTDAGITGDTPISFVEPTISARMALCSMLATKDLNWIVQRDLLIITTADVAKTRTVIRVYPVADLVFTETADAYEADFDSLIEVLTRHRGAVELGQQRRRRLRRAVRRFGRAGGQPNARGPRAA
jgi:hypothetical protein